MKKSFLAILLCTYTSVFAVEGYKDIYIKSNKDIYLHTIYCGDDLSKANRLRPSVVYTNTEYIEKGTYYIKARGMEYSTTFNKVDGQDKSIKVMGILKDGKTLKSQMEKKLCIVDKNPQIPAALNDKIRKDVVKSNSPSWNKTMKQYTAFFGQPASSKGQYLRQR